MIKSHLTFLIMYYLVTFIFIDNVLHETKENFLNEIRRIITPNGKIAIVEWEKISTEFGSPIGNRLDRIHLAKMLDSLGFSNISIIYIGENFYRLIAQK